MEKRRFGLTAAVLALLLMGIAPAQAQELVIGYTNDQVLLVNMPEYQDVQQQLQQMFQEQQEEIQQRSQELTQLIQQYREQQSMLSEEARTERQQEIRQLQREIRQAIRQNDQELRQRERELMQPLFEELQAAIEAVAQERGISIVIRQQALLYTNGENVVNITADVAERLGIDIEQAASAPASN